MSKKEGVLENYFSPVSRETPKRRRCKSSPEEISSEKVPSKRISTSGIMELILENISDLLDSKFKTFSLSLPSRDDFKSLERKLDVLALENQTLKKEVEELKIRESKMYDTIDQLINSSKIRNLVFRGLRIESNKSTLETVQEFCRNVLGVEGTTMNRAYQTNKKHLNGVIIVEFNTEGATHEILKNVTKLKNTGVIIHRDVTIRTRRRKRCLLQVRKKILDLDSRAKIQMRNEFFIFKEKRFLWDLEYGLKCEDKDGVAMLKQLIGKDFTEEMERSIAEVLGADKQYFRSSQKKK